MRSSTFRAALLTVVPVALVGLSSTPRRASAVSATTGRAVEFKPDKMYEFALLTVKAGKQQQLMDYFGAVFPLAMRHGVRPVVSFTPIATFAGDVRPSMFFVNEWPSEEAFRGFVSDPQVSRQFSKRDDALDQLINAHARVAQPVTVSLREGDVVEFAALWIKPGKGEQLSKYFGKAMPIAIKHGVKPVAAFQPTTSYASDFVPQMMALNQWPAMEVFQRFVKDPDLAPLLPERDGALSKMVVIHSRVRFDEEGK